MTHLTLLEATKWLNLFVNIGIYCIYPFLLIEWNKAFGLGNSLTILIGLSIATRVLGAISYGRLMKLVQGRLDSLALVMAATGCFFYSFVEVYSMQLLAIVLVGLAHGLWTANLQYILNKAAQNSLEATRAASGIQLSANIGIITGSILSSHLAVTFGFSIVSIGVSIWLMLLASVAWQFRRSYRNIPFSEIQQASTSRSGKIVSLLSAPTVTAIAITVSSLIAYSSLNYFAPLFAKAIANDFPVGQIFAINAALVIIGQSSFSKIEFLHRWELSLPFSLLLIVFGFTFLSLEMPQSIALYMFVSLISLAEVMLFPSLSGLFKSLVNSNELSSSLASSALISAKIIGLGAGGAVWPKLSSKPTEQIATYGVIICLICFSISICLFKKRNSL